VTLVAPLSAALALSTFTAATAGEIAPQVNTVALDLGALDEDTYRRVGGLALQKQAVLRLVQESFAVVAASAAPDIVLAVEPFEAGLRLTAKSRAGEQAREVQLSQDEPLEELHLEISQKLVELARSVTPPPLPVEPPKPPPEPRSLPPPPLPPRWWTADVRAGADVVFRKGGNDPQARLDLRWGGRLGAQLVGALAPSHTSDLKVLEWTILAGPSWRQALVPRLDVEIGLLAGLLWHHFTIKNPYSLDTAGNRRDWAAALPMALAFSPIPMVELSLRVAPRVCGESREHFLGDRRLWFRDRWALETGLSIGGRF
jgi:hypothetical protein